MDNRVKKQKEIKGKVVGLKNLKTVKVEITRLVIHPKYLKTIKKTKRISAHNDKFSLEIGDSVSVVNSRPYSATKRFLLVKKN